MLSENALLTQIQVLMDDSSLQWGEQIQALWSHYGQIVRLYSVDRDCHYIVKIIAPKQAGAHPRGWNTGTSHARKLKSYQVESRFYEHFAQYTDSNCKVPRGVVSAKFDSGTLVVMEDLDALGYHQRYDRAEGSVLDSAIKWLAFFHMRFCGSNTSGLWPVGTYWHLATRQDEWQAMPDCALKDQANLIDLTLRQAEFQSLLHGDAKLANFCFQPQGVGAAAVDFQYTGRGPGVKDLAYLAGSAMDEATLFKQGDRVLKSYIKHCASAVETYCLDLNFTAFEREVQNLYPLAWADFYRFLLGWNPHSWKLNRYMEQMAELGLKRLQAR